MFAQRYGILKGQVFNKENNQPVHSANILVKGTLIGTISDFNGNYSIPKIRNGKYNVIVSIIGYEKKEISGVNVEIGKETVLDIFLEPASVQIGQVVITAGKRVQTFAEVPASISVIEPRTLDRRNTITIDDALRQVSGINLIESQVSIRGSSGYSKGVGSRTLMLVDGIPFMTGDTGELIFETVPTFQVDRIEILKGASSALYGSGAMGGVVNVLTKDIPDEPSTFIRLFGGFYDEPYHSQWEWSSSTRFLNGMYLSHSGKFNDLRTLFSINRTEDDGYRKNTHYERWNVFWKNNYQFTPSKNLMLSLSYYKQNRNSVLFWKDLSNALIPPDNQVDDQVISERYSLSTSFKNTVTDKFLYNIKGVWFRNYWRDNMETGANRSRSDFIDTEIQFNYQPHDRHILTFGVEGNGNRVTSNIFGTRSSYNSAIYLQDEYKVSEIFRTIFGARFDMGKIDSLQSDYQINPKLGFVYSPIPLTSFRFSAGRAFRFPSIGEAFTSTLASGVRVIPNPDIKPEKNWTFEIGVNHILTENIFLDASIFQSEYNNLIEAKFISVGKGQFINVTRARIQGAEVSTKTSWLNEKVILNFSYTFLNPKDINRDDILRFRSKHLFYSSLAYIFPFIECGIDFRYISRIEKIDEEFSLAIRDSDKRVPTYVIDTHLSSKLVLMNLPVRLSLHVNNLLQYNYVELIGNIAPIRHIIFRVETNF